MMKTRRVALRRPISLAFASVVLAAGCRPAAAPPGPTPRPVTRFFAAIPDVIPVPASLAQRADEPFSLIAGTSILVDPGNAEAARTAEILASVLRPSTGFAFPVASAGGGPGGIALRLAPDRAVLGAEGY